MIQEYEKIGSSPVFEGIAPSDIEALLSDIGAYKKTYRKDEIIRHTGDELDCFLVLLDGSVCATLAQGERRQIISWFAPGDSFAEAVPVSLKRCPVEISVQKDAAVLFMPAHAIINGTKPNITKLHTNLMHEMSKKVSSLSFKLGIMGEPKLSDRILAYLETLPREKDGSVRLPMKYKDLAEYLGVNKASLSRALRVMEEGGLIVTKGRTITILRSHEGV